MVATESDEELVARGAALVREHARVEHQPAIILRSLAVVLVELRTRCTTSDGEMDLLGRSQRYRDEARRIYAGAGIAPDSEDRVQAAVRWHIGNHIRERFDVDTLRQHGLLVDGPRKRVERGRKARAALVTAASAERDLSAAPAKKATKKARGKAADAATATAPPVDETAGARVKLTADHLRFGQALATIAGQMRPDVIDNEMTPGQAAKLDDLLAETQTALAALRRHTKKRRSATS
ncbi:hypothetical protein [Streptomyces sp. DH12]|uniref:hypothetical protein n=1 Tax=Streptomyces sp. DH12 TaxID=2857010 RepID=UPI001E3A00B4|nr:hypothetical protein [Streptomyces sp. DH12]